MLYSLVLTDPECSYDNYSHMDEIDIVESPCFLSEERAKSELQMMQKQYQRREWAVSCYKIGESHLRDGFARIEDGKFIN